MGIILDAFRIQKVVMRGVKNWQKEHKNPLCHRGCAACCKQYIPVLTWECVLLAHRFIKEDFTQNSDFSRCPFLDCRDQCSIYGFRPFVCRVFVPKDTCINPADPNFQRQDASALIRSTLVHNRRFCHKYAIPTLEKPLDIVKGIWLGASLIRYQDQFRKQPQSEIIPDAIMSSIPMYKTGAKQ